MSQPPPGHDRWGAPPPGYGDGRPVEGSSQPPGYGAPPAYGQPPGHGAPPPSWQGLPPEDVVRMHQPGVIPLRPLTLSDIFSGALRTMRRNPEATLGMALLVLGVLLVPSLLISMAVAQADTLAVSDVIGLTEVVRTLFAGLASLVLTGFVIYVVSEAALGDKAGMRQTWDAVKGRIPALLGYSVLAFLLAAVAVVAVLLVVGVVGATMGEVALVVAVVLLVLSLPLGLWIAVRLSLGGAAVVLERVGPLRGMARSWRLTSGSAGWRVLGITMLAGLLAVIITGVLTAPLTAIGAFATANVGLYATVSHLAELLVGALATPFTAGVSALLYLDLRIRREGLDVMMARAAQQRAAARRTP